MTEKFMTIRQLAKTGVLPEYALRQLVKSKKLPVVYTGNRALLPYSLCLEVLNRLATENQN
ncbi:MAG: hypothetical protein ACOX8Q_05220 [Christensenellales bacterium]|jgi:hypothetical protein